MKVTRFIDRKVMFVVLGPVVRHVANLLSLYLAGQGVSTGLINQLEAGVIALATVAINVVFELRDQGNVAEKSAMLSAQRTAAGIWEIEAAQKAAVTRDMFDRESV